MTNFEDMPKQELNDQFPPNETEESLGTEYAEVSENKQEITEAPVEKQLEIIRQLKFELKAEEQQKFNLVMLTVDGMGELIGCYGGSRVMEAVKQARSNRQGSLYDVIKIIEPDQSKRLVLYSEMDTLADESNANYRQGPSNKELLSDQDTQSWLEANATGGQLGDAGFNDNATRLKTSSIKHYRQLDGNNSQIMKLLGRLGNKFQPELPNGENLLSLSPEIIQEMEVQASEWVTPQDWFKFIMSHQEKISMQSELIDSSRDHLKPVLEQTILEMKLDWRLRLRTALADTTRENEVSNLAGDHDMGLQEKVTQAIYHEIDQINNNFRKEYEETITPLEADLASL